MAWQDKSVGFLLADVSRQMRRTFQHLWEGASLTSAQGRALVFISLNEGVRQVILAELLEVQPIVLARLVDQLVGAGLIERRADPTDRRAYQIYLKPAGTRKVARIKQFDRAIRDDCLRGVSEEEIAILMSVLLRIRSNLTPAEEPRAGRTSKRQKDLEQDPTLSEMTF